MKTTVEHIYTSVACNRTPEIVDWNEQDLICFGARNAVVIYDRNTKAKDPLTVLSHHTSIVNSVKWLRTSNGTCTELLSCSADKTAAIWTLINRVWEVTSTLVGHDNGVNCVHGLYHGNNLTVYTGSIDSTVRVWERIEGTISLKQTINLQSGLCLTLQAFLLPIVKKPILFCALDDHKIHIFANSEEYHRVHMLTGHEDWVRGIDILKVDDETMMVASSSQDTYIRLWKIQRHVDQVTHGIKVEQKLFCAYDIDWSVKLDAVLAGHEGWVYGVQWQETKDSNGEANYRILSSSLDKTLIIWEPESQGGAWVERVRVGEVGGNGLGFYGSRFGRNAILAHGYNGSLHMWQYDKELNQWVPSVVVSGHFGGVEDVRWEGCGRYLASVSLDQTTRVHAPWRRPDGSCRWHEISRPQVHGYDLAALCLVSPTQLVSAAEEKVVRVFAAPTNFLANYENIVGEALEAHVRGPEGASVPSLGLSNKAVYSADEQRDGDQDGYFVPAVLTEPPTEETLMAHSLWPETHKLYGHGYEVYCLAASADGTLLASACRATSREHAAVILWETRTWQQIQKLPFHQLTVTQLAFSPDSRRLLSVSRDRRWALWRRADAFELEASSDKSNGVHTRIIWCCAWSDGQVFGTGSRDGKVCVWTRTETSGDTSLKRYALLGEPLEVPKESVTALDFAPQAASTRTVAVGFESGRIRIYAFDGVWNLRAELDNSSAHHLAVRRLAYGPRRRGEQWLASCGADHLLRIYALPI